MKGLAFAVSLFSRLSAEFPHLNAIGIVEKIEEVARRLTEAGKVVDAAFGEPVLVTGTSLSPGEIANIDAYLKTGKVSEAEPVHATVGGASTPVAIVEGKGGTGAAPAPTPVPPGIEGLTPGK